MEKVNPKQTQPPQPLQSLPLTPEQQLAEREARIDYFLKKRGLYHNKERMLDRLAELEQSMEKHGVSFEDLQRGIAPEEVLTKAMDLEKARVIAIGVYGHTLKKAQEAGELEDTLEQEYQQYKTETVKGEEKTQEIEEAKEIYFDNPTRENEMNYFKKTMGYDSGTPEERFAQQQEERDGKHQEAMEEIKQKTIEENARNEAKKRVNVRRMIENQDQNTQAREEALGDPRLQQKVIKPKTALDNEIKTRTEQILNEEYS